MGTNIGGMKKSVCVLVGAALLVVLPVAISEGAPVNVTQEHNDLSRDGVYIDSAFTPSAASNLARDTGFDGTIAGNVLGPTVVHRRRPKWSDGDCSYRIRQCLRA